MVVLAIQLCDLAWVLHSPHGTSAGMQGQCSRHHCTVSQPAACSYEQECLRLLVPNWRCVKQPAGPYEQGLHMPVAPENIVCKACVPAVASCNCIQAGSTQSLMQSVTAVGGARVPWQILGDACRAQFTCVISLVYVTSLPHCFQDLLHDFLHIKNS